MFFREVQYVFAHDKRVFAPKWTHYGILSGHSLKLIPCHMPKKLSPNLQFLSSVIATNFGFSRGINLCQPPIRATGTRAKLRVWRPRPSSAEAFFALAWNIHSQPPVLDMIMLLKERVRKCKPPGICQKVREAENWIQFG